MFPSSSSITFARFWWTGYKKTDPNQICNSVKDIWLSALRHLAISAHNTQGNKKQKKKKWDELFSGLVNIFMEV